MPGRSLKARALQLLAQREQSRVELRRKLLASLQRDAAAAPSAAEHRQGRRSDDAVDRSPAGAGASAGASASAGAGAGAGADFDAESLSSKPTDAQSQVDAVLDWLAAHGLASDERFAESRVHARSARYGNLRIRQELKQHAVSLTPEAQQALVVSEEARAASVYQRRYPQPPATPAEAAKRARFLATRGFSPDVIRRVLRTAAGRNLA